MHYFGGLVCLCSFFVKKICQCKYFAFMNRISIKITKIEPDAEGVIVYHLSVAPDDMGRVIGKRGRIAKALRTIMRAGATKQNLKVSVVIE